MTGEHKSHSDTTTNTACNQKQQGTKGNVSSLHVWGWIYVEMFPNFLFLTLLESMLDANENHP